MKTMKTLFTILSILISINCLSQTINKETTGVDVVDETLKVNSLQINTSPTNYNEGTNNPESTGSVKQVVNNKEIYIKDYVINGLNVTILNEPNN